MYRRSNIIIFSSGVSARSGLLEEVRAELQARGFGCSCWQELFGTSNNAERVALLPMLIKKIPTFDFALLICEGHDRTVIRRDGSPMELQTMRDNVLFEIGLCAVALGLERVILLADRSVRLPEDLQGVGGDLALRRIVIDRAPGGAGRMAQLVERHIQSRHRVFSPVVIGASASTASGYATNFVYRCVEHIWDGFVDRQTGQTVVPVPGKLEMEIVIPYTFTENTSRAARERQAKLRSGIISTARRRNLEFNYYTEGDRIIIRDYPTTLVTSYSTARSILKLQADDTADPTAERRFVAKELNLFEAALEAMLEPAYLRRYITHYHGTETEQERLDRADEIAWFVADHVRILREDY